MKIGQHIYQLRTTQNLTQEELASRVYVTRQTVSNWERCHSYPDLQSLMTISISLFTNFLRKIYLQLKGVYQ